MRNAIFLTAALAVSPAMAQTPTPTPTPTQCDLLAGHVEDPDRVGPGAKKVADNKVAIAACGKDLAADSGNRRLQYQLARVLFYDDQVDRAIRMLGSAADAGSQQAQFVLGYITDEGHRGVKKDVCKVEDLWVRSARQGRSAALVSYPHHVMGGNFTGCRQQANDDEVPRFLEQAKQQASGFEYYGELLVAQLTKDFAAYRAAKK